MRLLGNDGEVDFSPNIVVIFIISLLLLLTEVEPGIDQLEHFSRSALLAVPHPPFIS